MINDSDEPIILNSEDDDQRKNEEDIAKLKDSLKSRQLYSYSGIGNNSPTYQGSRTTFTYDCNGQLISIVEGT